MQTAQFKVEELQSDIDEAASYLADGIITATSDGTVMSVNYAVGTRVKNTDSPPVPHCGHRQHRVVYVSVSVDQEDIGVLKSGDPAQVVLSAFEDTYYDAVIYSISTSPAMGGTSTVSYAVTVQLQGDTSGIFNGMSATVTPLYLSRWRMSSTSPTGRSRWRTANPTSRSRMKTARR